MPEDKDATVKATGTGRTLAIGDIHGCRASLENLAEFVGISDSDTVVTLGDYVDRGPDSKGVIEFLIALGSTGTLVALRGNHEVMMLEARKDQMRCPRWLEFGGDTTLESYGACPLAEIPGSHWEFLEATRNFHETGPFFFVHANANPNLPLEEQDASTLFWERFEDPPKHRSGKTMVCGHTSQKSGEIRDLGHAVCIDTFVYGGGWLTCLDVGSGRYWQTNESGERRERTRGE